MLTLHTWQSRRDSLYINVSFGVSSYVWVSVGVQRNRWKNRYAAHLHEAKWLELERFIEGCYEVMLEG